jgi:outer membrane protein
VRRKRFQILREGDGQSGKMSIGDWDIGNWDIARPERATPFNNGQRPLYTHAIRSVFNGLCPLLRNFALSGHQVAVLSKLRLIFAVQFYGLAIFMKKTYISFFFAFFTAICLFAQPLLPAEEAVRVAIAHNYQVQIAQNNANIDKLNNYVAEMTPRVNLNIGNNIQLFNLNQKYATGAELNRNGVLGNGFSLNASTSYPIYTAGRLQATKERLNFQEIAGTHRLKAQMNQTAADVLTQYFDIVRQQRQLQVLQQSIEVSQKRLNLVRLRQTAGQANNSDLFLAEIELDTRKQTLRSQQYNIRRLKADLYTVLNVATDTSYVFSDSIKINKTLIFNELKENILNNPELMAAESAIKILTQVEKEIATFRKPEIRLNGGLGYNNSISTAGFTTFTQNYGPTVGATLTMPLYTGNVLTRQEDVAKANSRNATLQREAVKDRILNEMYKVWLEYETLLQQTETDKNIIATSVKYLDLIRTRYEARQSTELDFLEAQRRFEEVNYNYINNLYKLKYDEIILLKNAGKLVGY